MEGIQFIDGVWFRSHEKRLWPFSLWAWEDIGRLTIWPGKARFHGSKGIVWIESVRTIRLGRQGIDFLNPWVHIEHGHGRTAYLADGRDLGWRGLFGGTRRMFGEMEHLTRPSRAAEALEPSGV